MAKKEKEKVSACRNCKKKIHFGELAKKWFHDHNFMTFCWGVALKPDKDGKGTPSPVAEPLKEVSSATKPARQRRDNRNKRTRPGADARSRKSR